jgi:condensin-2 complex subunit G2
MLGSFHEAKRYKGVDAMLLRVYGPILWRSLKCANAIVRAQASAIFFDAFPIQDPDAGAAETENMLQKQFDLLVQLLKDNDHRVRTASVSGVCHVLREFWEAIPPATTKQILSYVVGTLGFDSACPNVRFAVISGLSELLENPLAHDVLKGLLRTLANSIHDKAEKVRVVFINLLCKVRFWIFSVVQNLLV